MQKYEAGIYEVIVVGAGHAGCEAALAAARMGCSTLLVSMNIESIAFMPCNPSIGGPAKAQLVREIDALGGEMALNIDKSRLQIRMINTGKGPAVQALRAQADKSRYHDAMLQTIYGQENLDLLMAEIIEIESREGRVTGLITRTGARYQTRAAVITTGTFLKGRIIIGDLAWEGGPNYQFPASQLSASIQNMGIALGRFKTGTPPRIDCKTVDFSKMIEQPGDDEILNFSFISPRERKPQLSCWLIHSNQRTHQIVRDNLDRAPLFTGFIKGRGPRYCPSFEDKVVRFAHKDSHQLFLEPEGFDTDEMYVQGLNTSLPEDVQIEVLHSLPGLEEARVIRTGYAIEYDYVPAAQLRLSLETRAVDGLYTAGQINGTSGYEEAAAQGLVAGINAALKVQGREPLVLKRSEAYIGVLIDDLVNKEADEPYRLMTSRAEYRLLLRQDNADLRLTSMGREAGLVSDERWERFCRKRRQIEESKYFMQSQTFTMADPDLKAFLEKRGSSGLKDRSSLWELLKRPEIKMSHYQEEGMMAAAEDEVLEQLEIEAKYEGYLVKQHDQVKKFEKMENRRIPEDLDYDQVYGLLSEARQKLKAVMPVSIGQASRISGVTPADIGIIMVYLEKMRRNRKSGQAEKGPDHE